MIKELNALLVDDEVEICNRGNTLEMVKSKNVYPEDYVSIEKDEDLGAFILYEVHRNDKKEIIKINDEKELIIWAAITYKRMNPKYSDNAKKNDIICLMNLEKYDEALKEIISYFDSNLYSINKINNAKVSLIEKKEKISVMYDDKMIVENVEKYRGYLVLFNYCSLLKDISYFYDMLNKDYKAVISKKEACRIYLFGKL